MYTGPNKQVNVILEDGNLKVDREPAYVSISGKEQVVWVASFDFEIVFPEESPFEARVFSGGLDRPAESGPARVDSGGGRKYRYIVVRTGEMRTGEMRLLDPTIRPTP